MRAPRISASKFKIILLATTILILLLSHLTASQSAQELCSSSQIGSFLCKAGQAVIGGFGGAAKLAGSYLRRPKHWGVPENEPLELNDNYIDQPPPPPLPAPPAAGGDFAQPPRNRFHQNHNRQHQKQFQGPARRRERVLCQTADGARGVCRPLTACYHRHGSSVRYEIDSRQCPGGLSLVCCPKRNRYGDQPTAGIDQGQSAPIQLSAQTLNRPRPAGSKPLIALDTLKEVIAQVFQQNSESERSNEIEKTAATEGLALRKDSPGDLHSKFIQLRNTKVVGKLAKDGADFLAVASQLVKSRLLKEEEAAAEEGGGGGGGAGEREAESDCRRRTSQSPDGTLITNDGQCSSGPRSSRRRSFLPDIDFSQTDLASRCPGDPVCPRAMARERYRTYDGSCNNLRHTAWGRSNTPYTRILPPDYEDSVSEIRKTGVTGATLPNPRTVSLAAVRWSDKPDAKSTLMLMQWGQFVIHDLSLAATTPMFTAQGTSIDCCNRKLLLDPRFKHPACISVLLPDDDPFYAKYNVGCMNLVRSAPSPPIGCRLRAREQLNQLTSFLDGSMIYGNDEQQALGLRRFQGGLLKSSQINGMEFLPFDGRIGEGCILPTAGIRRGMRCFVAGDGRVNELTGLVTMHAMFLREHNRLARMLRSLNPSWQDEKLFQEARRIVIAQLQHITYNEWLPLIVGPIIMRDFKLELSQTNGGYSLDYDIETDPSIINEFAGAAHRLHSLVQSAFNFQTEDGQLIQQFKLRHIFNNPASLYREGNYDACIHSMVNEPSQSVDSHFSEELTNHLFQDTNSSFGMDLVTINLQRGRDHGLPGYNFFRQACGLTRLRSFQQLEAVMVEGASQIFSRLYAHVDDIDLFIAGNYERKLREAMVGPVFACIIGEQYRRLKAGDRYWFENGDQAGAFTPSQLSEIKRSSLARIICDNSEGVERIQPLAFLKHANWNPRISCDQIPWMDLRHWQTEQMEQFDPFTFRGSREPVARRLDDHDHDRAETLDDGLD